MIVIAVALTGCDPATTPDASWEAFREAARRDTADGPIYVVDGDVRVTEAQLHAVWETREDPTFRASIRLDFTNGERSLWFQGEERDLR